MQTSTATLTALDSPYALSIFTDRLARYRRMPVDAHGFIVSIPDAGRVLVRQEGRSLTLNVVAPDEAGLAASMAAVVAELEQGFGRADFRRSISIRWQRRDLVPAALR
ncbi:MULTISPECIES: hypothetical protein [unclassified Agreia]|uniref:hypothetical protein n=1 Tax=unclassified Agreia TaxID=2641148 RepID=UPI0006F88023|nr:MULTISPECIES: hypothetical protein [Microbacteriaceae]KQM61056.1 hypothetical protein ASE64_05475 [Agreia sp. Leaf210]KQR23782.1 hypothetical protein ASF79_00490 [Agreia sp. Leaf335]PPF61917.1 hypothetical protein C5E11_13680 [Clavibacter michiganensis]